MRNWNKKKTIKIGSWNTVRKVGNNYELLNELEPFSWDELQEIEKSFRRIFEQLEDNNLKVDERAKQTVDDFLEKAKKRIMMSAQQIQEDYEHANQVKPSAIVSEPKGGTSDKAETQQSGNNNNDSNVSV